ncbi:MAG TPA: hypothetical protein VGC98_04675 [Thermoleophilaceae bacterium]|jgi:hypothetical protein
MNPRKHPLLVALAAFLVAVPMAVAALPGRAKYVGRTSDDNAVTLKLNAKATRVTRMRIHYTVDCDNGRSGTTYTDILGARVRSNRSFSASGTYTGSGDGSQNTFKASGKLGPNKAHGKFSLKATGKTSSGAALTCKTGKLTWSAKRKK